MLRPAAGMGVGHLLRMLCGFLKDDMEVLVGQPSDAAATAKRMQFWLMLVNKLAVACPEAASTGWEALLKWLVQAHRRLGR